MMSPTIAYSLTVLSIFWIVPEYLNRFLSAISLASVTPLSKSEKVALSIMAASFSNSLGSSFDLKRVYALSHADTRSLDLETISDRETDRIQEMLGLPRARGLYD